MSWKIWYSFFFVHFLMIFDICTVSGDDFDDTNCKTYVQINNRTLYNTTQDSVHDPLKRPLGFMYAVIPFETNNVNAKNPCFVLTLKDSTKQTVQVLATGAVGQSSSICVKSQPSYFQSDCQPGYQACTDSPIGNGFDSIKYVFYCDGCESDVAIWFRLTVSPEFTDGLDFETWCGLYEEYPNSLIRISDLPVASTTVKSKASHVGLTFILLLPLIFVFFVSHALY